MDDDEEPELDPPGEAEVVQRMLCLAAVAARGSAASDLEEEPSERAEIEEFDEAVREWLEHERLDEALAASERELFAKPLDGLSERELIDSSWRIESTGVLLWALGAIDELPPYDEEFEGIPDVAPLLEPVEEAAPGLRLRPRAEIERARDLAELWHWRSRTSMLVSEQAAGERVIEQDLDAIVRDAATKAGADGTIPPPIDEDFPAFGKAYRDLSPDEYHLATSIAAERHLALNWVCGYGRDWDGTPTDT